MATEHIGMHTPKIILYFLCLVLTIFPISLRKEDRLYICLGSENYS